MPKTIEQECLAAERKVRELYVRKSRNLHYTRSYHAAIRQWEFLLHQCEINDERGGTI